MNGLGQIAYHVSDVARSTEFFRDKLGLPFLFAAGPGLAFFDLWGVRLMLESGAKQENGSNGCLYFKVDNVDRTFANFQGKLDFVDEPHLIARMPDHELWMVFFRDPDDNLLAFMEERR